MELRKALLEGNKRIAVWGTGHIGYSTMSHFAERGVQVVGFDIAPEKVAEINRGEIPIMAMDYWLGFDPKFLYQHGMARATSDFREVVEPDMAVHFIAIPTERNGVPWLKPLEDVINKIIDAIKAGNFSQPPLVIIESTLTPTTTDKFVIPLFSAGGLTVGEDVLLGCAPRRDWFSSADNKSLRTITRIYGGVNERTADTMFDVLSIVCESLVRAPDHHHAEVVKSIENAYRHAEVALAFQLTRAFPNLDMRTVLGLVGTKWNVGTFFPSFGVGGYCIPLSSHYVMEGAERPEELTLLQKTVEICAEQPDLVAQSLVDMGVKKVGILGLSYIQNVKVWAQSPTLRISQYLKEAGVEVKVHDPHYTDEEVMQISGLETFDYPEGLEQFDAVLVVAGHREYRQADHNRLFEMMPNCRVILDNSGMWQDVDFASVGIEYHVAGDAQWLNSKGLGRKAMEETSPAVAAD
ncbi:MAG: nucleotide sugar dehydrogenase [Dehalococcoidia bacterium]